MDEWEGERERKKIETEEEVARETERGKN